MQWQPAVDVSLLKIIFAASTSLQIIEERKEVEE